MESLVVTLETAKKLKAAGFPQDTAFCFDPHSPLPCRKLSSNPKNEVADGKAVITAPTAQELAEQLPSLAGRDDKFQLQITKATNEYQAWYSPIDDTTKLSHLYFEQGDTIAEALAALWLNLHETSTSSEGLEVDKGSLS
jgi:hypothetical protein